MRKNSPDNFEWKKENQDAKKGFDFDSFLRDDPVWGMEPDWQEDEEELAEAVETTAEIRDGGAAPAASERGYQAPPRPEILVAEPGRARVVIKPERSCEEPPRRKRGPGAGAVIGIVVTVAVIGLIVFLVSGIFDSLGGTAGESPALPEWTLASAGPAAEATPAPAATEPPAATEAPRDEEEEAPEAEYYSIRVTAGSGGNVFPGGETLVAAGSSTSFQILAEDGYELSQLLVDGVEQTLTELYYFDNVQSDHSIYAVFTKAATPAPEPTQEPAPEPTPEPTPEPMAPPAEPEAGEDASATDTE